jgi:hypothetical protein
MNTVMWWNDCRWVGISNRLIGLQVPIALSPIHTLCNSQQHTLSLLSLLCVHQLLSSLAIVCLTAWLIIAMQWLTTMGAPMGLSPNCYMQTTQLTCPICTCDIALGWIQQKTPLPTVSLLFHDIAISADLQRTLFPVVLPLATRDNVHSQLSLHCLLYHNLVTDVSSG